MASGDSLNLFMQLVQKTRTCWLWQGAISAKGHGRVTHHGHALLAHRASWILHYGLILPGLVCCHKAICPNKHCVRPSHLYLATISDNTKDGHRVSYGHGRRIPIPAPRISPAQRFFNKVKKTESCWLWEGAITGSRYGEFFYNGKVRLAHRVSWMLHHGVIPQGLCVCHTCDVRLCINPTHLFLGTYKDNLQDASRKGHMQAAALTRKSALKGRWAHTYNACLMCQTTTQEHHAKGLCQKCYMHKRDTELWQKHIQQKRLSTSN